MKKILIILVCIPFLGFAQVGIGTTAPEGVFDVVSPNMGMVLPRVSAIENVIQPDGTKAADGTVVYDVSREKVCYRLSGKWACTGDDGTGTITTSTVNEEISNLAAYIKSSNPDSLDRFGSSVSISNDGTVLVVGALWEDSVAKGVNGNQSDNSSTASGAAYIFRFISGNWVQEAYLKASWSGQNDYFGEHVAVSGDGTRVFVGAPYEDSDAVGVGGNQLSNATQDSGAVYAFRYTGASWLQEAYIKASNTGQRDVFGRRLATNDDGSLLAIGAIFESSDATGTNGDQSNDLETRSGAVYVFERTGVSWAQNSYLKASNTGLLDYFGSGITISGDGRYIAICATGESSSFGGVNNPQQSDNSTSASGAIYIFERITGSWEQTNYIKSNYPHDGGEFGRSMSFNSDGSLLAVGSHNEKSNASGINGDASNLSPGSPGAVFILSRTGATWRHNTYIKAMHPDVNDRFGFSVTLSGDGARLVVTANNEESSAIGFNGDQTDNSMIEPGAGYVFSRFGNQWRQESYIKLNYPTNRDRFGSVVISGNGKVIVGGCSQEDSNAIGIGGNENNDDTIDSGAIFIYN